MSGVFPAYVGGPGDPSASLYPSWVTGVEIDDRRGRDQILPSSDYDLALQEDELIMVVVAAFMEMIE